MVTTGAGWLALCFFLEKKDILRDLDPNRNDMAANGCARRVSRVGVCCGGGRERRG